MKKKKKKIILLTSLIASIALVFAVFFVWMFSSKETVEDTYSKYIKVLNENDVSLVIYGDEVKFREGVNYKIIDEIDKTSFNGDEFLVMNDRLSNAPLDDEDYTEIKDLISNGVTFIYIGESKLETFKQKGFIGSYGEDDLEFVISAFSTRVSFGPWDRSMEEDFKKYNEILGESIVYTIVYELRNR